MADHDQNINEKIATERVALSALTEGSKEYLEQLGKVHALEKKRFAQMEGQKEQYQQLNELERQRISQLEELAKKEEKLQKTSSDFANALQRTVQTFTGLTDGSETLIGSFMNMEKTSKKLSKEIEDLKKELDETADGTEEFANKSKELERKQKDQKDSQKALTESMEEYLDNLNPVASLISKITQSTVGLAAANDAATAGINAATGATGEFDAEIVALELANRSSGISAGEMAASYQSLMGTLSGFGVMAESERKRLGELGARLDKVGVSGADFAGSLETMTRNFGMSTKTATRFQKQAFNLAQTLGKDVGQVFSELNQALPQLSSYGADAVEMFFDLEKQSQKTGLAVNELIGIAGNYQTFDSAATAAGNLNAVLGTQLFSTMGLLEAQLEGPQAVIDYMSETLGSSVSDFNSLNKFQKDAIANAAGMNAEQLSQLMNQEAMTKQEKDRATSLNEAMAAGRSLAQELGIFVQNFAISITPFINGLSVVFEKINGGIQYLKNEMPIVADAIKFAFSIGVLMKFISIMKRARDAVKSFAIGNVFASAVANPIAAGLKLAAAGGIVAAARAAFPKEERQLGGNTTGRMASLAEAGAEGFVSNGQLQVAGMGGPFQAEPPVNTAVINNKKLTALANNALQGGGDNQSNGAVVAAINNMSNKLDNVTAQIASLNESMGSAGDLIMNLDGREFGRVINEHIGEGGSYPISIKAP